MQNKKLPENLAQLAGLLGFAATFFPGIMSGANPLMLLLQSLAVSLALGAVIWTGNRTFLKWQLQQLKPVLEEIEIQVPEPKPSAISRRRSRDHKSVRIKGDK